MVMLAYSFLGRLELRQQHRQKGCSRPRAPFPPSPGPATARLAGCISGGRSVAPPPSRLEVGGYRSVHSTVLTTDLTKEYWEKKACQEKAACALPIRHPQSNDDNRGGCDGHRQRRQPEEYPPNDHAPWR
jgi:hypothetical protein